MTTVGKNSHLRVGKFATLKVNLDDIRPYQDVTIWEKLPQKDRAALALRFVQEGYRLLMQKSPGAYQYFSFAENIAFYNKQVWLDEAKAWLDYGKKFHNERALNQAKEKFLFAMEMDYISFQQALDLAKVYSSIAASSWDATYLYQAHIWFDRAKLLAGGAESYLEQVYTYHGSCWELGFRLSQEPSDLVKALEAYDKLMALGCQKTSFLLAYAKCFMRLQSLVGGQGSIRKALDILDHCKEGSDRAQKAGLRSLKGRCLSKQYFLVGQESFFHKASNEFQTALSIQPGDKKHLLGFGQLLLNSGIQKTDPRRICQALEIFSVGTKIHPDCYLMWQNAARALAVMGHHTDELKLLKEAEKSASKAIELAPEEAGNCYIMARIFAYQGEYFEDEKILARAIDKYQKGLTLDKESAELWRGLGEALFTLGEWRQDHDVLSKGILYQKRATEYAPEDPYLLNQVGWACLRLSEYTGKKEDVEEAVTYLEKAISLRGGIQGYPEVSWLYNYGCALDFLGDFSESTNDYEQAIQVLNYVARLEPEDVAVQYNLALAWSHLGEATGSEEYFLEAIEHFRSITELDPQDDLTWNDWGVALLNLASLAGVHSKTEEEAGLYEEAQDKLERAIELGNAQGYYYLACMYALNKRFEEAVDHLYKAYQKGGLPRLEDMLRDDWLDEIKEHPSFKVFVQLLNEHHSF